MNIVCTDALGISCGTWIALLNGVIGAVVAAVIGVGVALVVVRLTNAQQQRGVDRTVEVAAIADFVAAIEELEWALKYRLKEPHSFDPGSYVLLMRAAVTRLHMARRESKIVADILLQWPEKMHNLANQYRKALLADAPFSRDIIKSIMRITTIATLNLPDCLSRSKVDRQIGLNRLRYADQSLLLQWIIARALGRSHLRSLPNSLTLRSNSRIQKTCSVSAMQRRGRALPAG